jgi:Xaa-Pro aminopeptidase
MAATTRIERALAAAQERGLTGVLATAGPDLLYLAGHTPPFATERLTLLAVQAGRDPVLVAPELERPDGLGIEVVTWADGEDPYAATAAVLDPAGRFALSDGCWALHVLGLQEALPGVRFSSMTAALPLLRAVKDADELDRLAAAGAAADAAFLDLVELRFGGRREVEVAADLAALLREHGHDRVDFTIVASGPNAADPHHDAGERTIEEGDVVMLDFGGRLKGYGSDCTRVVHVGEPAAEAVGIHELVRAAQQAGVDAVAPGVTCEEVDRAARRVIADAGLGERFIHRTGHGIGLEGHEPPYLVAGERLALEPGMCFSVEPGVYLPGRFGVRIEDVVAVTPDGARRLNESPREPLSVT